VPPQSMAFGSERCTWIHAHGKKPDCMYTKVLVTSDLRQPRRQLGSLKRVSDRMPVIVFRLVDVHAHSL